MAEREGLSLSITTKSNQVVRDIDLLKRISERSSLSVNLSITTVRAALARTLEPRAPRPDLRLGAVRELRDAGIAAGVLAMPIVPGVTDAAEDLSSIGFVETLYGFYRRPISETREAVPSVVLAPRQRAGFLSRGNHRFGSESSRKIRAWFTPAECVGKILEVPAAAARSYEGRS
jgi:hypothetical protein